MNIIFMSVLAVLVLVAQPTLAGSGGSGDSGNSIDSGDQEASNAPSPHMVKAINQIANQQWQKAVRSLRKEINANPNNPEPWVQLGLIVKKREQSYKRGTPLMKLHETAIEQLGASSDPILRWKKSPFVKHTSAGHKISLAEVFFHYALDLNPDHKIALHALASNYLEQDKVLLDKNIVSFDALISASGVADKLANGCKFNCSPIEDLFKRINAADVARAGKKF